MMMIRSCTNGTMDKLPGEIMLDILSRLSVQTLCRCRFVSKYWYNLINDPVFVDLHHSLIKEQSQSGGGLLFVCLTTPRIDYIMYLVDNENIATTSLKAINIYFDLLQFTKIVGSSNGLLCLCSSPPLYSSPPIYENIYVCNPVTREILKLPKALGFGPDCQTNNNFKFLYTTSLGFAFHAPTQTYKVVRTWYYRATGSSTLHTGIEIYTVGSGIWKRIDQGNIYISSNNNSVSQVYLNGVFHWEMDDLRNPQVRHCIGAIDLGEERFTTLGQPSDDKIKWRTLSTLHQYLSLAYGYDDHIDLWIMKQYGVVGSWTKQHVIRKQMLGPLQTVSPLRSFKTMKNGHVLIHGGKYQGGFYDLENHEFKQILIDGIQLPAYKLDFILHVGSLISPKSIAGLGEEYRVPPPIRRGRVRFKLKRKSSQLLTSPRTLFC